MRCRARLALVLAGAAQAAAGGAPPAHWAPADNGADIGWQAATQHCAALGPGWRLPAPEELMALFDPRESVRCGWNFCHVSPAFALSGNWFWSNARTDEGRARGVNLDLGRIDEAPVDVGHFGRALCVQAQRP